MSNFRVATLWVAGSIPHLLKSVDAGPRRIPPWVREAILNHKGSDLTDGKYTLVGIPIEQLAARDERNASYSNAEAYTKIAKWAHTNMPWGGTLERVPLGVILAAAAEYGLLFGNYPDDTTECVHFFADPEFDDQGDSVHLFLSASPDAQWNIGGSRGENDVVSRAGTLIACLLKI